MNKFELFCMIYLALDADWNETENEELGQFLSGANPFLFEEVTSADPAVYEDYCKVIENFNINIENSYKTAQEYIGYLDIPAVSKSFASLKKEQWDAAVKEFLSTEHKGQFH